MATELLVASGIILAALLALLARRFASADGAAVDETVLAKRFIDAAIEQHVARLTAGYAEVTASGQDDSDRFRLKVESFIAEVLQRDLDEPEAAELRDAVREILVLEREYVYDRIVARIRSHQAEG